MATKGFPLSPGGHRWVTLQGWLALAFVVCAVAVTLPAVVQAIRDVPAPGISTDLDGAILTEVLPEGPAWRMGARVGDRILGIDPGEAEEAWVMETERGTIAASRSALMMRETLPLALVAVGLAALSLLLLARDPRAAAAAAAVGVALTERSLMATGDVAWSTAGAVAALLVAAMFLAIFGPGPRRARLLLVTTVAVVTGFWLWARYWDVALFETSDALRLLLTAGLVIAIVVIVIGGAIRASQGGYDPRRLGDVLFIVLLVGLTTIAVLAAVPPVHLAFTVLIPLLLYPLVRGGVRRSLDRLVLGDLRSRAAVEAVERERARTSREIHDEPLQRLAAIMLRLDTRPELADETGALRLVSAQLRDLSVELHPQVLVDLGLEAALTDLAGRVERESGTRIILDVDEPPSTLSSSRPPGEVELAVYRIAQEAVGNAVRHSGAQMIEVTVRARSDEVSLVVHDDGVGLDAVAAREATQRGHVGLHSMAERAELIGAQLRIEAAKPGTRVTLRWPG